MSYRSIIASFVAIAMIFTLAGAAGVAQAASLTQAQISAIVSLLSSFGANQETINNVTAALNGQATSGTGTTTGTCSVTFAKDLSKGASDSDVVQLQKFLNSNGYTVAASGAGSVGNESNYFGALTVAALAKFQAANGISPAAGYFGPVTRAKVNSMCSTTTGGTTTGGTTTTTTTGIVGVSLAASQPTATLVAGQAIGQVASFTFANPSATAETVTNLVFNRLGISNDATLGDIYLYDGATRLTDAAGISSSVVTFNQPSGLFTVPAYSSRTITVRANIVTGTSGQTLGFALASVTGNLTNGGVFPINGNLLTIATATPATVDLNSTTSPSATSITAQSDYTVWQNTVTIGTRVVNLQAMTFRIGGSVAPSDVANYRLFIDGVQVGSAVQQMDANRYITFDLSANPVSLQTGGRVIKVIADLNGGASRTLQVQLRQAADLLAVDSQLMQPVLATKGGSAFAVAQATEATIASGSVSVNKSTNSPSSNITSNGTSIKWASFDFRASGEAVKIDNLNVTADTSDAGGLNDGKVFVNGVQVGSTKDLTEDTAINFTFGSSFIIQAGTTATVDIYADAKTAAGVALTNTSTGAISVAAGSSNGTGQNSLTSISIPSSAVAGNTLTVSTSSLSVTKYSGYGNQTIVAGVNQAKVGSFVLSAGSSEGVNVNTISVKFSATEAATMSNLMLKDNVTGAQIGTTKTTPASGVNSLSTNFDIAASGTKVINIYADILSGAGVGDVIAGVGAEGTGLVTGASATANGGSSVTTDNNLQTITIGSGTLSLAVGAGDPTSTNVVAGSSSVNVGQFRFSAASSSYTVQELKVKIPNGAATSVGQLTLSYKDSSGTSRTESQALTIGTEANATATFTGLTFYVPKNDEATLDVYVSIPTIASGAVSGAAINATIDYNEGFKAVSDSGAASTSVGSADVSSGGTFYVRKSIPTIAVLPYASTTMSNGAAHALYKFTVSADPAGAVEFRQLNFNVATSNVTVSAMYLLQDGSSTNVNALANAEANASGVVSIIATNSTDSSAVYTNKVEQIAAGTSRTYILYGTVAGWGTTNESESVTISFADDTSGSTTSAAGQTTASADIIWSDRSATSHTTATSDWINGYLLKDLTNDNQSYSR